ncbi:MAG: (2Fe-2S)-binding protein [Pyrinomonadaceae bacterium]|nr:(2Fe-2S)-binding protein [Pyrinomonadaceae bacterium]
MSQYPPRIAELSAKPGWAGIDPEADGLGVEAALGCGSIVRFSVGMDDDLGVVTSVRFNSNGCGYMVAAAEALCSRLSGIQLGDLGGLSDGELDSFVTTALGEVPKDRRQCVAVCSSAVRKAFADRRDRRAAAAFGESDLICSCFGVGEGEICGIIERIGTDSVSDVTAECNAGGGCGSCRMLIQELIDSIIEHN